MEAGHIPLCIMPNFQIPPFAHLDPSRVSGPPSLYPPFLSPHAYLPSALARVYIRPFQGRGTIRKDGGGLAAPAAFLFLENRGAVFLLLASD